jgi:hypothetical protein
MVAGDTAEMTYRISIRGESERTAARLRVDLSRERYELQGFGGNYCFWPNTPAVDYTLDNLQPVWTRTQMFLSFWEPENDDADPEHVNWAAFEGREDRQWILQTEMDAAGKMARRGIPFIISCWQVPDWMKTSGADGGRREIARDAWPELVESICAYLLYLKREYGAEPAMFSFNEPQLGRMSDPEHHRDFSKLLGRRMAELGLQTGILAGDVANPRGDKIDYAKPLLEDPEGRRYVKGLSFHSWGGADPETYAAWGDLAEEHGLPLFVGELGWNAMAHRSRASGTALYALKELEVYMDILRHARPQVLLEWEYGGSYPIVVERNGQLEPTARYWMVHQFATMTPSPAVALATESDNPRVLLTAFRGLAKGGREAVVLHIANLGPDRPIAVEGLPGRLTSVDATWCDALGNRSLAAEVPVTGGTLVTVLPPLSLYTVRWTQ